MRLRDILFLPFFLFSALCKAQISDELYNGLLELIQPKNKQAITDEEWLAIIGGIPATQVNLYKDEVYKIIADADKMVATTKDTKTKVNYIANCCIQVLLIKD